MHEPGKWSGVYFVRSGERPAPDAPSTAGHLVFRGGKKPRRGCEDEEEEELEGQQEEEEGSSSSSSSSSSEHSHTFMAVAPEEGRLYFFPGTVPHCVFPVRCSPDHEHSREPPPRDKASAGEGPGDDESAASAARISIAINFDDTSPPPRWV